jgi:hypothetical protein
VVVEDVAVDPEKVDTVLNVLVTLKVPKVVVCFTLCFKNCSLLTRGLEEGRGRGGRGRGAGRGRGRGGREREHRSTNDDRHSKSGVA